MSTIRTLIMLLVAIIIAGVFGFGVDRFAILYGHADRIAAQCLGISASALCLLVLIAAMGLQARKWH